MIRHLPLCVVSVLFVFGCAVGVSAAQDWYSTPVISWSSSQVKKFLSESPWAGRVPLRSRNNEKAVVTWESAPIVREARDRAGWRTLSSAGPTDASYVVSIQISGSETALALVEGFAHPTRGDAYRSRARDRTLLLRRGKPALSAAGMDAHVIDDKGARHRILPESQRYGAIAAPFYSDPLGYAGEIVDRCGNRIAAYGNPFGNDLLQDHGPRPCNRSAVLVFSFPAMESISPDESVDFVSEVLGPIRKTFHLRDMTINGALQLR